MGNELDVISIMVNKMKITIIMKDSKNIEKYVSKCIARVIACMVAVTINTMAYCAAYVDNQRKSKLNEQYSQNGEKKQWNIT